MNQDFRVWLTTNESPGFPLNLLQNSLKLTKESPGGVKANIINNYKNILHTKKGKLYYENVEQGHTKSWQVMYLSLCYFHSIIKERQQFGPLGWNNLYDFNDSDILITTQVIKNFIKYYKEPKLEILQYLISNCFYGGKVNDQSD